MDKRVHSGIIFDKVIYFLKIVMDGNFYLL
jgi:hypothetical protein